MLKAADLGAMILPPMVAWYHRPTTVQEIIDQTVGKVLDAFGVEHRLFRRWEGAEPSTPPLQPPLRIAKG
jgi:4-hydroxy-3-polyprenylbenzoate decarboxylase